MMACYTIRDEPISSRCQGVLFEDDSRTVERKFDEPGARGHQTRTVGATVSDLAAG